MADEIKVPIVSTYDDDEAKKAIKDAEKIEDLDPELEVTADTAAAQADLKAVQEEAEKLSKADVELVIKAKIDAAKADLEELETKLKALDDTSVSPHIDADNNMGKFGDSTDEARGRVSELVGESVAELPGIGEALGPAAEGLSSITEAALSGEAAIGGLVTAAGGMALVTLGFKLISDHMEAVAASEAFHTDRVDSWSDAIRDAETAIKGLREQLAEQETVEFVDDGDVRDAVDSLVKMGFNVRTFTALIDKGDGAIAEYMRNTIATVPEIAAEWERIGETFTRTDNKLQVMLDSSDPKARAFAQTMFALQQGAVDYTDAQDEASDRALFYGETVAGVAGAVDGAATSLDTLGQKAIAAEGYIAGLNEQAGDTGKTEEELQAAADSANLEIERQAEAAQAARDALNEQTAALLGQIDAQRSAADAQFALADATDDYSEFLGGMKDEIKEAKGDQDKLNKIYRDGTTAAAKMADATLRAYEEQATANGVTLTATQRQTIWNRKMLDTAATQKGPLLQSTLDYIAAVNGIPPEKVTVIEAAIAAGDIEEANRLLDEASATREAAIVADANTVDANAELDEAARERTALIKVAIDKATLNNILAQIPGGAAAVAGQAAGQRMAPAAAPMTVNVNLPTGSRGVDVVRQVSGQARRSGRRYGVPTVHYARRGPL